MLDTLGARDADELVSLADPEVEWYSLFAMGDGGVYRGHDGTRRYMRDLEDAWEEGYTTVDDILAVGDVAFAVGHIHYRGKGSGLAGTAPVGWVVRVRDGKVVLFRAFRDPERVLGSLSP